jgi:UDP-N-acetylmuramate: L-alanyl-gamma-D-glutamyl-meso-diaminopimelate ligase
LNNLEFDHADIFPDLAAIETQFHHLVRTIPSKGMIISNAADPNLRRVIERGCWTPLERFGDGGDWTVGAADASGAFDVDMKAVPQGRVDWALSGDHNRHNALAAIAAARHAGVPVKASIDALKSFRNVKRRQELRGIAGGVAVYDDFAHHPTAIAVTIAGLREKIGQARLLAVLEPRSNTMKQGVMKDALADSLKLADRVYCYTKDLAWDAAATLAPLGNKARCVGQLDSLVQEISADAKPGDHVLVMSNGGFEEIHEKLLAALARK